MILHCQLSAATLYATMTTLPYSTIDLASEEIAQILSVFNSLQCNYQVNFKMGFNFPFKNFSLFETYDDYAIGPVIELKQNERSLYITFTHVFYKLNSGSRYPIPLSKEYQTWCVLPLDKQYGHILIKSETVFDKIHELVHPIEIDFIEDPDFSKRFYVMASTDSLARNLLDNQFRSCLKRLELKDAWIEVAQDKLIIGNKKRIDTQATLEMANFICSISELLK
jgi:hypothetical protein